MQLTNASGGETIFSVGDTSTAVYVIEDGEVAITVDQIARLHAGGLFGKAGVLENELARPPESPCPRRGC
jgi:CRP-like cAMP-binding protein